MIARNMSVLVLGDAGYIGSRTALDRADHDVVIADKSATGYRKSDPGKGTVS